MRELKGNWLDLFNGFMIAFDLRKMFFGFCGIVATVVLIGGVTLLWSMFFFGAQKTLPYNLAPHEILQWMCNTSSTAMSGLASGETGKFLLSIAYYILIILLFVVIWSFFGGAIARTCACEIGKGGERIETSKSLKFVSQKFGSFFWAPLICILGYLFFYLINFGAGLFMKILDFAYIGAPLAAILLPLAILAGFVMTLLIIGTIAGLPLFLPAVAAEGTDSFDAVSRSFAYVYSKPWHYIFYQIVGFVYGAICIGFVVIFAVFMTNLALDTGSDGFNLMGHWDKHEFKQISASSWKYFLSEEHAKMKFSWNPIDVVKNPSTLKPYDRPMSIASGIAWSGNVPAPETKWHKWAHFILVFWLFIVMGFAYGYAVSYFITQQSIIYFVLRKKVDDIDMNEIYLEEEEQSQDVAPKESVEVKEPEKGPGQSS